MTAEPADAMEGGRAGLSGRGLAALLMLLALGMGALAVAAGPAALPTAEEPGLAAPASPPVPAEMAAPLFVGPPEFVGPPVPEAIRLALAGQTGSGPIRGPHWDSAPLPGGPNDVLPPEPGGAGSQLPPDYRPLATVGSELPDPELVQTSRAANPALEVRQEPGGAAAPTEAPLSVEVTVERMPGGAGELLVVRARASAECLLTLVSLDAAGKGSLLLRSPRATRRASAVVRAAGGTRFVLALAVAPDAASGDLAAALSAAASPFAPGPLAGEEACRAAWGGARELLRTSGGREPLQRRQWAVAGVVAPGPDASAPAAAP